MTGTGAYRSLRVAKARRRRGVARDHQSLDAARDEVVADRQGVRTDLGDGQRPVRTVGGVADVDDVLVGQLVDDRPRDGESADAGIEDPDGRQGRAHDVRYGFVALRLPKLARLAFGPGQQIGRQHSGNRATEVPLPRHPGGAGQHAEQDAAVDEQHDHADDDLPHLAGEEPEHDQERQPAEDQARRADVVGLAAHADVGAVRADIADQPRAEATENPDDGRREDEPRQARERHQEAEDQRRNGVGDQVIPVRVQQRREDDPHQAVGLQRPDAVVVEAVVGQRVEQLDDPQQHDEADDRDPADHPRRPLLRLR